MIKSYVFTSISNERNALGDRGQRRLGSEDVLLEIVAEFADFISRPDDEHCANPRRKRSNLYIIELNCESIYQRVPMMMMTTTTNPKSRLCCWRRRA